jgi:hypothetical protein
MVVTFWGVNFAVREACLQIRVNLSWLSIPFLEDLMTVSGLFQKRPKERDDRAYSSLERDSFSSILTRSISSFNSLRTCGKRLM